MSAKTILIVEDEPAVARALQSYLNHFGYSVAGIVDNGEEALRLVAAARPGLALMDIEIQGAMDGFELAEQFRDDYDIPVIFLTGRSDDQTLERVRQSESFGYLLKPYKPEELKASVELALIRHGHEVQLKRIEHSFSAAIRVTGDAILLAGDNGTVTFLNHAAERLTGWPVRKALGHKLEEVFRLVGDSDAITRLFRAAHQGAFVHEATLLTAAGREVPIEVNVSSFQDGVRGASGSVLVFRDITERKQFEAQLKKSQAELRQLALHLELAREAERTRIAREIHDELGQILTGFKFDLAWLDKRLSAQSEADHAPLLEKVRAMTDLLGSMVQSVRRIAAELRPGVLDDLGLAAAVEWQAAEFQKHTGIKAQVRLALSERELPQAIATALFRVLQESLTNVARHAQARCVRVHLRDEDGQIVLEVSDDGRGSTETELEKPGAFGLLGMRERIAPLRGRCEIIGTPQQGTVVRVRVPLETSAAQKG